MVHYKSTPNYIDVLGLGSITVDFVCTIENWPAEGVKVPLRSLSVYDGGLVGTAVTAVARLGGTAAFAGKLGSSEMASRAIVALEKEGIDTSYVIRKDGAEPIVAFILTNNLSKERNIFWTRQGVQYPMPDELPEPAWYKRTRVLLIDFESGLSGIEAAKIAGKNNIPVVLDIEQNEDFTTEFLEVSSHIIVSEEFSIPYTGKTDIKDMLVALRVRPEQVVVITRGSKGCSALTPEGIFQLPAFNVNVVDTTGCGDVFHGAYALAIARNKNVKDACVFASAAAALCATKLGGRDGISTAEQLESFLKKQT